LLARRADDSQAEREALLAEVQRYAATN